MWFDDFEPFPFQIGCFGPRLNEPGLDMPRNHGPTDAASRWGDGMAWGDLGPRHSSQFDEIAQFRHENGVGLGLGRWLPVDDTLDTILKSATATEPPEGSGEDIVVIGTLPPISGGGGSGGGIGLGGLTSPTAGIAPPAGDEEAPPCNCAGMTEAQQQEQAIDAEVAEVLEEILARANQDMEYGALIWIDSNGDAQHTPLIATPDERARIDSSALPRAADGITPDWSVVVGMVHSHPEEIHVNGYDRTLYVPSDPDYLLYPWQGDWQSYDSYATLISNAGGDASSFKQYIIGWGENGFVITEYSSDDRGTTTSSSGETVDPNTEGCTC